MDLYKVRQQLSMGIPITQINLRATDYSRVSTLHLKQQSSLKNQKEHFDEMIINNEHWTYVQGYVDEGITGTSDIKRENFMKMIDDAKSGKFDLIITKEISRFSRNTLDSIRYTRELLSYGVAVYFVNDNINTAMPDSELRLTIMASMAQDEIRRLSERVKFGMQQSIKNGRILGNDTLCGYRKDKESNTLVIVAEEAELVRRLFTMYAIEEKSLGKIVKQFNDENIRTCYNKKWCISTLTRMLKNPKYKGYYCGGKSEIEDYLTKKVKFFEPEEWTVYENNERIPAIVSEELWERANLRLKARRKSFGSDYVDKTMYKNRYPLSAKIYCGNDNEVYHRRKQLKASDDVTWVCSKYLKGRRKACDTANLRESEIYIIFKKVLRALSIDENMVVKLLDELYRNNQTNIEIEKMISKLTSEKEKLLLKKDKLLELNLEGNISNSEFSERNNQCNNHINEIAKKIAILDGDRKAFSDIKKKNKELEKLLKQQVKSNALIDKFISLLLDKIVVTKIDEYKAEFNIFLRFSPKYVSKDMKDIIIQDISGLKRIFTNDYEFKRGFDSTSAKRYIYTYMVSCYLCF